MKRRSNTILLIFILVIIYSCVTTKNEKQTSTTERCNEVKNKSFIVDSLANFLNKNIENRNTTYSSKNGNPIEYAIVNIEDSVISIYSPLCLMDNSIFAFGPVRKKYSYSNVVIIDNGSLTIFKFLNCPDKGDNISQVKDYLSKTSLSTKLSTVTLKNLEVLSKKGLYDSTLYQDNYEAMEVFKCDN